MRADLPRVKYEERMKASAVIVALVTLSCGQPAKIGAAKTPGSAPS